MFLEGTSMHIFRKEQRISYTQIETMPLYDHEFRLSIFSNTVKHVLPSNVATEGTGPKSSNSSCSGSEGSGAMRSSYFTSSS